MSSPTMSESPPPGLAGVDETQTSDLERPASIRSGKSKASSHDTESTPLLAGEDDQRRYDAAAADDDDDEVAPTTTTPLLGTTDDGPEDDSSKGDQKSFRWLILLALAVFGVLAVFVLLAALFAPTVAREYALQALVLEPRDLSIDSFTKNGVRARVQASVGFDANRVSSVAVRSFGRAGTWIAKRVECDASTVRVYAPEYGNALLGVAALPPIVLDIRNGHVNDLDFLADLKPGELDGIRSIANDWLYGRLDRLKVQGTAAVGLKSGLLSLGTQSISQSFALEGRDVPAIPQHNITRVNFHDVPAPGGESWVGADVSVVVMNDYPVNLAVPPLAFDILVPNCASYDPPILVANATTSAIDIKPHSELHVNVTGLIHQLPDALTARCPDSQLSPLDALLADYLHGNNATVFIRGSAVQTPDTPDWVAGVISSVMVPFPFPGRTFDNLIRTFSLARVHFSLPDPAADPDSPAAQPRLSAVVRALIALPKEMNVPLDVLRVRATADVYYNKQKLGRLDLRKWQAANSSRVPAREGDGLTLLVESLVEDAPLQVTNGDVFGKVVRMLFFERKAVVLDIDAVVDADVKTGLGRFVIKDIHGQGKVPIPAIKADVGSVKPQIGALRIVNSSETSLVFQASVNFTNPTKYSAHVPYVSINILSNGTVVGQAKVRNASIVSGANTNVVVEALWDPVKFSGEKGRSAGRELLSQYISGWNTTLTLKTHNDTIPSQPMIGRALARLGINLPTPRLKPPAQPGHDGDEDADDGSHFILGATMHLFTSTATFTLLSPLPHSTLYITHIDATAYYNHTEPVGVIAYSLSFAVPPGEHESPRLPVTWSLGSVGYGAVRSALGGRLRLDAHATVGVRLDAYEETVWYIGRGIGAKVRF